MRWLMMLALVLPIPALALGPAVLDSPDLRQLSAGPMVYGGSEGVTCTFAAGQPPRCSDGRLIATASATPRPCEQQQGVLTDVGVNVGCVTWDGRLKAHSSTTTLIQNGDRLNTSPWTAYLGPAVVRAPDGRGWRVCKNNGEANGGARQLMTVLTSAATHTAACLARAADAPQGRVGVRAASTYSSVFTPPAEYAMFSHTQALLVGDQPATWISPTGDGNNPNCIDALGCWHTATSAPGSACFGTNASGTTCSGTVHTVSTAGWPKTKGWIRVVVRFDQPLGAPSGSLTILSGNALGSPILDVIQVNQALRLWINGGAARNSGPIAWDVGRDYVIAIERTATGWRVTRDGTQLFSFTTAELPQLDWKGPTGYLGATYALSSQLEGSIANPSWSDK